MTPSPHVDKLRTYIQSLGATYGVGTQPFFAAIEGDIETVLRELSTTAVVVGGVLVQQGLAKAGERVMKWLLGDGSAPAAPKRSGPPARRR